MPAREVEQHDPQQDSEQSLSGDPRQRQDNAQRNQHDAEKVLADDLRSVQRRIRSGPELCFAILAEVIGGQLDENQRDDAKVGEETYKKNRDPDECFTPGY